MKKTMNGGDFDAKLAELQAKYEAEPTGMNDIEIGCLYCKFADKLTRKFVDAIKTAPTIDEMLAKGLRAGILVTKQKGKVVFIGYKALAQYTISGNFHRFTFQHNSSRLAEYDTPAQVEAVINSLKAAIERRDSEFTFPTIEELTTPAEIDADEYAISEEAFNVAIDAEIQNAAPETKESLREKACELADLQKRLDKEKSFAECSRDHLKTGQTWMRAATEKSDGAEFYKAQIAATNATIAKLNERIADLKAQITAVENELETVNKKIASVIRRRR